MLFHRNKSKTEFAEEDHKMAALRFLDLGLRAGSFIGEILGEVHKNIFDPDDEDEDCDGDD